MSEVERYWIDPSRLIQEGWHQDDTCVVKDWAYDRVVAERDALQQRLTAADERVDVLEGLLLQTNELLNAIQGDPGAVPSSSIDAMRGEVFTALKPVEADPAATCTWSESGFSWHTGCGKEWQFTDGGLPAENGMRFCHSCGKTLVAESAETP